MIDLVFPKHLGCISLVSLSAVLQTKCFGLKKPISDIQKLEDFKTQTKPDIISHLLKHQQKT